MLAIWKQEACFRLWFTKLVLYTCLLVLFFKKRTSISVRSARHPSHFCCVVLLCLPQIGTGKALFRNLWDQKGCVIVCIWSRFCDLSVELYSPTKPRKRICTLLNPGLVCTRTQPQTQDHKLYRLQHLWHRCTEFVINTKAVIIIFVNVCNERKKKNI